MVRLNRIYTKTGDDGTTGLSDGQRVPKYDLRVEAYGDVDEANSCIGMVRLHLGPNQAQMDAILARIQNDLFDLGADLSTPLPPSPQEELPYTLRILPQQVERLEHEIDAMNEALAPLKSFVLPGGSAAAAHLHLARCIVRRAERVGWALASNQPVNLHALHYLNRLSDLLFVLSRVANDDGARDVLWEPGLTRPKSDA